MGGCRVVVVEVAGRRGALLAAALLTVLLTACVSRSTARALDPSLLTKSDVDMVTDRLIDEQMRDLEALMRKLYLRNPRQLRQAGRLSWEPRVRAVFREPVPRIPELRGMRDLECLRASLDPDYAGDRVLAFVYGLKTMILAAYDDRTDFHVLDELDPQRLDNSARNVEIAAWKLASARDARGEPLLVSNAMGEETNLSFERLFGKLIARQDLMSKIVAERTNRRVKTVIQKLGTAVFLPVL